MWRRTVRLVGLFFLYLIAILLTLWAAAALYIDLRIPVIKHLVGISYALVIIFLAAWVPGHLARVLVCFGGFGVVLAWWLSLKPSNDRPWQLDVAQEAWAEVQGDQVILHNFRRCHYQTQFDYSCEWLTKSLDLSQLRGLDLFVTYWGSPYIAHPILSFQFGDHDYVAVSIETRKEIGQGYSSVLGFFRQYELIYIFADERDLVALRTNFRKHEEVYLYHTVAGPDWARRLFQDYLQRANDLRQQPRWYNALTHNCTTVIFHSMADIGRLPTGTSLYNWRTILNGLGVQMLYKGGNLEGGLPFPELQESAHINGVAREADQSSDFSQRIRLGRPGFGFLPENEGEKRNN